MHYMHYVHYIHYIHYMHCIHTQYARRDGCACVGWSGMEGWGCIHLENVDMSVFFLIDIVLCIGV